MSAARPVVLDTDLGTNVDDLLALSVLAGAPEVELVAVTTVSGDATARAEETRAALALAGRADVPVAPGAPSSDEAVEVLLEAAAAHPHELVVAAIGPMTNLARALATDPTWATRVAAVVAMGGLVDGDPETNVRGDPAAFDVVLRSGVPVTLTGLDVTRRVVIDARTLDRWAPPGRSAWTDHLRAAIEGFWWAVGRRSCHPHDPLALVPLLDPSALTVVRENIAVRSDGRLVRDPDGAEIDRVVAVAPTAGDEILARVFRPLP